MYILALYKKKQMKHYFYLLFLICFACATLQNSKTITVNKESVIFHNWLLEENEVAIFLIDKETLERIPINGVCYKNGKNLIFNPEFPLLENVQYGAEAHNYKTTFKLNKIALKQPEVTAVYPTANTLPENLLRMYISFSQPMKTTGNIEKIKLINENGEEIKGAIFNNVYELWDHSQTQLTIIFDPARVKTGLVAHNNLGRALVPNKKFKIVIEDLEDIYGQKLETSFVKTFLVTDADFESPNTSSWKINAPKFNGENYLEINFSNIIDKMSLLSRIEVFNQKNEQVKGAITIINNEKTWLFMPEQKWEKGAYTIRINSRLSDPSGNNLNGLFDHKIGSLKDKQEGKIVTIPFKII